MFASFVPTLLLGPRKQWARAQQLAGFLGLAGESGRTNKP